MAINRIMCKFLWGAREDGHMTHVVLWDTITRPYHCGGWNVKKIDWFNCSLRMKSPSMTLKGSGIWNKILLSKYLCNCTLIEWIRKHNHLVSSTSVIWNGFIRVFGWISKALAWKVGNGTSVHVGTDPIVGLEKSSGLSPCLVDYL